MKLIPAVVVFNFGIFFVHFFNFCVQFLLTSAKYSKKVKRQAIKLYMEGNSGRAVGRILGISKNTCLYWIKNYAKGIEPKNTPNGRVNVIEMDELYSFVERKKTDFT